MQVASCVVIGRTCGMDDCAQKLIGKNLWKVTSSYIESEMGRYDWNMTAGEVRLGFLI